ncbi:hypothetical protein PG985_015243 [Apiospora marii]|uniref:Uncharacterized protein n=1 Tax=Apiospora marii TaxID=335849 RepID=A0ABR1S683_9PEZI
MCIIEYIGYSCGHSSVPVLRLCPMTTHAPSNPVCKDPSHRPTMVGDMCPACSRVMHSRWVDIVMFEHQWMHERGTCGCQAKFPSLLHPRTIGANPGKEASQHDGQATLRGISKQMGEAISSRFESGEGTSATSHEDNATSATDTTPTKSSSLTVTPSIDRGTHSAAHGYNTKPTTAAAAAAVGQSSTSRSLHTGKGNNKKRTHKPFKQNKKKGTGKGRNQKQQQKNNHSEFDRQTMMAKPHDATTALLPPIATLSSEDEIVESFHLPSMELSPTKTTTTDETQQQGQQVNVRLASQFAVEWIPDHAERHRTGACNCRVRFERYQPYEVTENEYHFGHDNSQGSTTSYLDDMTTGMEALGFSEQPGSNRNNGGFGSSYYSGGGPIAISPTTATIPKDNSNGQDTGGFFPFASPSPKMAMSSNDNTGCGSLGSGPGYAALSAATADDNTTGGTTAHRFGSDTNHLVGTPTGNTSHAAAQNDYQAYTYNYPNNPAPPPSPISSPSPKSRALLYAYQPEQTLRPSDIAHWRALESSPDPAAAWASRSRPEDFGFRSADEAARALASTPEHVPIRSRPAAPVAAAEHLPNTLYYQHFDPDDPTTYPIVAWPLGAGPEGGPEYCHAPRWDACHLSRPRLRRSRSLDGSS